MHHHHHHLLPSSFPLFPSADGGRGRIGDSVIFPFYPSSMEEEYSFYEEQISSPPSSFPEFLPSFLRREERIEGGEELLRQYYYYDEDHDPTREKTGLHHRHHDRHHHHHPQKGICGDDSDCCFVIEPSFALCGRVYESVLGQSFDLRTFRPPPFFRIWFQSPGMIPNSYNVIFNYLNMPPLLQGSSYRNTTTTANDTSSSIAMTTMNSGLAYWIRDTIFVDGNDQTKMRIALDSSGTRGQLTIMIPSVLEGQFPICLSAEQYSRCPPYLG